MALKTFQNGVINNLTSTAHPLVTFVGGAKKKLPKGVTFINGEKVVLWNANELQISYIRPADLSMNPSYPATAFYASKDYLLFSSGNNIIKLNISNKSNISVVDSVQLGNIVGYSSVDSSVGDSVYYAYKSTSSGATFNQINVVNSTAVLSASNAQTINPITALECAAYTSEWLNANYVTNGVRSVDVRSGNTVKYSYTGFSGGSLSGRIDGPLFTKIDSTTLVGNLSIWNTPSAIGEFTNVGYTAKTSNGYSYKDFLTDGDKVACAGPSGFGLYERNTSGNYTTIATQATMTNHVERLIGKCRGNYYTICCPTTSDTAKKYFLRIYDGSGSLFETQELNVGNTRHGDLRVIPQLSRTGYLTIYIPRYSSSSGASEFIVIQCY